jgi:hypothetical protein
MSPYTLKFRENLTRVILFNLSSLPRPKGLLYEMLGGEGGTGEDIRMCFVSSPPPPSNGEEVSTLV